MDPKIRTWKCENGHIQGQMQRRTLPSGRHVLVLEVYRHAVDLQAEAPCDVDVAWEVMGEYMGRCDVAGCGATQVWDPGGAALREFVARVKKRRLATEA